MPPKQPNSFSSLCAHRAAGSKNAAAQSSNDASFGDLREEARSPPRLSPRRRGTCPIGGCKYTKNLEIPTNFCRVPTPIPLLSIPDASFFSHPRQGFPPPEGSPCRKLHKFFSKAPRFCRKLHDFSPKVRSFAPPAARCRRLLPHRQQLLATHSAPIPQQSAVSIEHFCYYSQQHVRHNQT